MKKTKMMLWALLLLTVNFQLPTAFAQVWDNPQALNPYTGTGGQIGEYSRLLVVNGNPAMVFYDAARANLVYVRATDASGTAWGSPIAIDATGNVGLFTSFAIVNGNPAVSYYDLTNGDLKYVRASDVNGSSWGSSQTITSTDDVGWYTSLAVVNGNPAISYFDVTSLDLKYVRASDASGSTWGSPVTVDGSGNVGQQTSLAVVDGNPAISYYDATNGDLKYVHATNASGSSWSSPVTIDATGDVGAFTSLAIVNGNPAISYYDNTNQDLKYVRASDASGGTWGSPVTVDNTGNVGQHTSLAIVNGNPAISCFYSNTFDLRYVRASDATGSSWGGGTMTIDATGSVGEYASLAIVNGNPAISYYDVGNRDLKYVRATNASGSSWGSPVIIDAPGSVGAYASLAVVNSNPAISYYDATNGDLTFVRAANSSGSSWGSPVTVDASGDVGLYTSLAIANGNPAISYYDNSNGDLKYVRASNASGSTWGTPVTIDATGYIGLYTSLAIVNGNPAISYYDASNSDLKYVRASDASGSSWGSPVTIATTGNVGLYTSLCIVNGNPAISYYDVSNGDLKYVRASDASGSSWGSPATVDATGTVGSYTSMAIVNGNPAISYYNQSSEDLKYVRASDASGSSWGTPATIDATGNVGRYGSLAIVNGNPAISYYDNTNVDLKYVRASDASGASWGTAVALDATAAGHYTSMVVNGVDVLIAYLDEDIVPGFVHGFNFAWTGGASTRDWFTTGNWSMGSVPTSSDNIGIPAGLSVYPEISTGTASCGNITVADGGSLMVNGGALQVSGHINNYDTIDATGGTITLNGSSAQSVTAGTLTATNLTLNNSAGATIESGTVNVLDTYTPTSGTLTTNGSLVLKSTVSGTARVAAGSSSGGYISGDLTVERYIPGKRCFRFLGHPFSSSIALSQLTDDIDITGNGGSANGFTPTTTNNPSAFYWDVNTADNSTAGNNPGWRPFTSATSPDWRSSGLLRLLVRGTPGQGLTGGSYSPSAVTLDMAGTVNQGTQVITLNKGSNSNFVACGNPFPSGLQMQNVSVGSNVGANYYAWDATSGVAGAYVTNAWSLSYVLPAWGAFFTTVSATDNITIEEADKATGGAALFKRTANKNWVELLISDSTIKWDRLLINLDDNAMDVEDNMDGKKLYNPGLDFFTLSKDDVRLAVDVRPYNDGTSIPLGLTAYNRYNKYVIKTGMFDIPAGTKLYLHDKWLNKKEELKAGFEYWFDVTTDTLSQGNNRFEINMVGQPTNGIAMSKNQVAKMQLMPNPAKDEVKISFDKLEGRAHLKLTGVTGQVIFSKDVSASTGSVTIPLHNIPAGIYIAELQSANARFTEKLIIE